MGIQMNAQAGPSNPKPTKMPSKKEGGSVEYRCAEPQMIRKEGLGRAKTRCTTAKAIRDKNRTGFRMPGRRGE